MAKKKMSEGLENALQKLVDRLVERMEDASQSLEWNKGWIQTGHGWGLPRNISGSPYMGMNAFLLSLHAAENSYKMPIYMTHLQAKKEKVHILPGSKSVPVFKWGMNIKDKEGKFVSEEDYRKMSEEQQKECTVFPYLKYFNEFNIDQTNYKEKYPDKYEKLLSNFVDPDRNKADTNGMYNNEALNKVIEEKDGWICPIVLDPSKGAAYSPGFNSIHIPPKENYRLHEGNAEETFKDGQEYYSTALHEMAHSTGHESVLKRDGIVKFDGFGSPSYAKEELVAELTAAMVSSTLGFDKRITENSAAYLKGWAAALRKEPKYIISVMSDVNKASRIELEHIDKQRKALGQKSLLEGTLDGLDEKADNEKQFEAIQNGETEKEQNNNKMDKKIFYSNLNANSDIELKEDPQQLVTLYENGDKQGLFDALKQAQKEAGAYWDLANLQSTTGENAEIIAEDEKYVAVKYPEFTDTFFMFEKVTEQQILHNISQYGLSEDDSAIAHQIGNEAIKKQFDGMRSHILEMPNGTVLGVDYDPSTNEMLAGGVTNAGLAPEHRSGYDHSITLDENIQNFSEELMSMEEYQVQEEDIEEEVSEDQEKTQEEELDVDKKELVAKEWPMFDNKLEMPSGDVLTVNYNKDKDTLDVLITNAEGKQEVYSTSYDHDHTIQENQGYIWEELSNKKQYQEKEAEKVAQTQPIDPKDEKKYYSSFAFMQDQEDTEQFDNLQKEGKYDEILNLASEYDQEQEIELEYVSKSSSPHPGDDLLAENEDYAVVYNNRVGGTYDLLKKYSENELREEIERLGGIGSNPSDAVKEIAYNMTADEFAAIQKEPVFEMPNGEALYFQYNKETDKIEVGTATNNGLAVSDTFMFERDKSVEANLANVYEEMSQWEQYREQESEVEESFEEEKNVKAEPGQVSTEENTLSGKEYFSTLMNSITNGEHEGHSVLEIKSISELRDYFKDNSHVNEWMEGVSNRELIEAGADKLPNIRYSHKEGRTLFDMNKAYNNIISQYADMKEERTRLLFSTGIENKKEIIATLDERIKNIAHRAEQAQAIANDYQVNISKVYGNRYFEEEHKFIPRAEYTASVSQGQAAAASESSIDESYCYSFARFESSERTKAFDSYRESGDHEALLHLAEIMDVSNLIELNKVRKNIPKTSDDKVLVENSSYAVTYNQQNNTYDLLRKIEKKEVLELIDGILSNDEIKASSDDVQKLAYEDAAQQIADSEKSNVLTMPNGEKLDFQYSEERNQVDVGKMTPKGMDVQYIFDYDISRSPQRNISTIQDELSHYDEFRILSYEEEEQRRRTAVRWRLSDHKFEMPSGDVLTVEYDQKKDTLNVAYINEYGKPEVFSTKFRHEDSDTRNVNDLLEKLEGMKQFQAKQEDKTSKDSQKGEVPHEDSLSDTNVVAEAKHIAATGVPIDKAEKMAKEKFEDINHENMHKEEERKSAEQEKKEDQQKEQQKKKEEEQNKENKNSNVVSSHAALLLAALVSSKNNNGVWLNPGFRKDAQFLFGNSPITGYNALMMNLHGKQNGYRSNIYTQYNPAKDNGMPIKEGEKTFYLSWTNWRYVKGAEDKQGISPKEYHALDSKEKKMYQPRSERKVMNVWNIDQTTFAGKDYDAYVKVIKENGDQVESLNTIKEENIARAYSEVVKKHPDFVVLQLEDDVFKAYKKGAEKISKATGIPMTKVDYLGKKVNSVEISKDKLDGYLSKIVNSGNQVVICDKPESPKLIKTLTNPEEVLQKANSLAKSVAKTEGLDYERVMVVQDAQYLPGEKKIVVSGMSDPGMDARSSAIAKANDIYRVLAAMTGTSDRLDRGGHVNLTPIDDVKYEKLVRELTAGVFMARQGLPATFSKESMELVPYWEREIKESPRMVSIIEKDVNNAVEVLDRLEKNIKPDYKKIVGIKAEKQMLNKSDYTIIKKINEFPNIETKEIVVVKDTVNKKASVILPQGASLEKDNEVPGMRKDRIKHALSKEGFEVEKFYNTGGRLGLKQPNNYFADKEISVVRLHQYELVSNEKVDLSDLKKEVKFKIKDFQVLPDKEQGRYFFHIQAEGEKAFDIVPEKKYVNSFFKAIKSQDPEEKSKMIKALSEQFYKLGKSHPEMTDDLVSPRKVDVDMSRISSSHIYKDSENHNIKYIKAVIDGQEHVKVIPADQYNKLFAAEDKPAYAKALAAVTFESLLKKGNTESVDNSKKEANEKAVSKATPIEQSAVNKTVGQQEDNEHHQSMKFGRR